MSARYHTTGNSNPHRVATSYQHTPRVAGPLTRDKDRRRNWPWAVLAILLVLTFDHAMRADAARLCGNDATAYSECGQ